jgi:hypothetical protein
LGTLPQISRILLCAPALALAFAAPLRASEPVTRAQVLDAIRVFEANAPGNLAPSGTAQEASDAVARATGTVVRFSLESDDVVIDLGADSIPWCDVKKGLPELSRSGERGLLLAAYLCGCVKAQLVSGKQDPNPYPGWVAMLHVYRAMKMRDGALVPEAEALLARQMDGTLESQAVTALQRSRDSLRKTYGAAANEPRQVVPASSLP